MFGARRCCDFRVTIQLSEEPFLAFLAIKHMGATTFNFDPALFVSALGFLLSL